MKRLLIVYHTQFGGTAQMAEAAARGARQIDDVETIVKRAADAIGQERTLGVVLNRADEHAHSTGYYGYYNKNYYYGSSKAEPAARP